MRVGFVGLGSMGAPMARRLLASGFTVVGFDPRREVVSALVAAGGAAAPSLRALAERSDVVITMLPNGDVVRRVVVGDGGDALLSGMSAAAMLVDMSSSSPTGTRDLGGLLAERGIAMIDAPVSGGVPKAEAGRLAIMAGGDLAVIERCRPLLTAMGAQIFMTGPLGSGHALKALNNLVSAAGLVAAAEALLIGRRFGLDPGVMIDVFNASTARNNSTENKFKQFVLSRRFASGFSLDLMVKDLGTALDLAAATETPSPLSRACLDLWTEAQAGLEDGADHTAIVQWLEQMAKTEL